MNKLRIIKPVSGLVLVFQLAVFSSFALAAEEQFLSLAPVLSEDQFFAEIPHVVTATRLKQNYIQTPVAVTVIDRAQIEASGFVEIVDLLRLVPGFQVAHSSSRSFAASYHGLADGYPSRLQVLIDGRSVYTPLLSSVDWSMLGVQMDDIERVEVIRGPNAPAYGANAFLGTVNIITREPLSEQGSSAIVRGGDPDMRNMVLKHADSVGALDYRFTASYRENSGFDLINDDVELSGFNFRGEYSVGINDQFAVQLGYEGGMTDEPENPAASAAIPNRVRDIGMNFQQLRWQHAISDSSDVSVQFYHNYYRQSDAYTTLLPVSGLLGVAPGLIPLGYPGQVDEYLEQSFSHGQTERYDLEAQQVVLLPEGHQFVWGLGYRQDQLRSTHYLGSSEVVEDTSVRAFFNGQYVLSDPWVLNLGLMVEEGDLADTQYSPRLALNWNFTPGQVVRASVTGAHRTPSLLDANWDWAWRFSDGTPIDQTRIAQMDPLKSEKIISYELGYTGEFPEQAMFVEVKLFREKITDVISDVVDESYPDVDGDAFVVGNDGYSNTQGIEGQISWRPSARNFVTFQYGLAATESYDVRQINPFGQRDYDDGVPKQTLSLLAAYGFDNDVDVSMGAYRISEMEWLGDGKEQLAYNRVDVRLAKQFDFLQADNEISLVVQNVGADYTEFNFVNNFTTRTYFMYRISMP